MLRRALLVAGLALLPAVATAQGVAQPEGLRPASLHRGLVPVPKKYAVAARPGKFIYTPPVRFGGLLPQQHVVYGEEPDDDLAGFGTTAVSEGAVLDAPRTRRVIQIIE